MEFKTKMEPNETNHDDIEKVRESLREQLRELEEEKKKLDNEWEKLRAERKEFEEERKKSGIQYKLFIGNLSKQTTESDLRLLFEPYGTVKEIVPLKDREGPNGVSKRSCFVIYYSKANADKAIASLNGKVKDKDEESPLVVRYARDKDRSAAPSLTASLGSLLSPANISSLLNPNLNPPSLSVSLPGLNSFPSIFRQTGLPSEIGSGGSSGSGSSGTSSALNMNNLTSLSSSSSSVSSKYGRGPPGANLYVNNLTKYATENDVRIMFSECGNVISVKLFPEGYGFVSFDNVQSANKAIGALNGMATPEGKRLEVSVKKDKTSTSSKIGSGSRFNPY